MAKKYEVCSLRGFKPECDLECVSYCAQCSDFELRELDFSDYDCTIQAELLAEEMRSI